MNRLFGSKKKDETKKEVPVVVEEKKEETKEVVQPMDLGDQSQKVRKYIIINEIYLKLFHILIKIQYKM